MKNLKIYHLVLCPIGLIENKEMYKRIEENKLILPNILIYFDHVDFKFIHYFLLGHIIFGDNGLIDNNYIANCKETENAIYKLCQFYNTNVSEFENGDVSEKHLQKYNNHLRKLSRFLKLEKSGMTLYVIAYNPYSDKHPIYIDKTVNYNKNSFKINYENPHYENPRKTKGYCSDLGSVTFKVDEIRFMDQIFYNSEICIRYNFGYDFEYERNKKITDINKEKGYYTRTIDVDEPDVQPKGGLLVWTGKLGSYRLKFGNNTPMFKRLRSEASDMLIMSYIKYNYFKMLKAIDPLITGNKNYELRMDIIIPKKVFRPLPKDLWFYSINSEVMEDLQIRLYKKYKTKSGEYKYQNLQPKLFIF